MNSCDEQRLMVLRRNISISEAKKFDSIRSKLLEIPTNAKAVRKELPIDIRNERVFLASVSVFTGNKESSKEKARRRAGLISPEKLQRHTEAVTRALEQFLQSYESSLADVVVKQEKIDTEELPSLSPVPLKKPRKTRKVAYTQLQCTPMKINESWNTPILVPEMFLQPLPMQWQIQNIELEDVFSLFKKELTPVYSPTQFGLDVSFLQETEVSCI